MQAIILAGGRGERLRPLTQDRPKAMVEVHGIPLLGYQLRWLRGHQARDVIIACGYRHEVIRDYFGDGDRWGLRIAYSVEEDPLGRGGALKQAMGLLRADTDLFVATNGDIITSVALDEAIAAHRAKNVPATVVVTPLVSPYGIVDIDARDRVTGFREKPSLPYWINAGVYILAPEILALLPDRGDHEDTTFPRLAAEGRLGAYRSTAFWRGVDTAKDLSDVADALAQGVAFR